MTRQRRVTVLTTMNRGILEGTGRTMLCSVLARWPSGTQIVVQYEKDDDADLWLAREELEPSGIQVHDLLDLEPDLGAFLARNEGRKEDALRFAWRRFSYKSFAITGSVDYLDDCLVWLDADTLTHADVTHEALNGWLRPPHCVAFLGRAHGYTETGFLMFDLQSAVTRRLMRAWRDLYNCNGIFDLSQWHDCIAFDTARAECVPAGLQNNLTPWGRAWQHVFINGPIGAYMDHMKGGRKEAGKSRESDIIRERVTPEFLAYLRRA